MACKIKRAIGHAGGVQAVSLLLHKTANVSGIRWTGAVHPHLPICGPVERPRQLRQGLRERGQGHHWSCCYASHTVAKVQLKCTTFWWLTLLAWLSRSIILHVAIDSPPPCTSPPAAANAAACLRPRPLLSRPPPMQRRSPRSCPASHPLAYRYFSKHFAIHSWTDGNLFLSAYCYSFHIFYI
jgi:hypothetical protein